MACARCGSEVAVQAKRWCGDCELLYDTWVRQHASDIVWMALCGTVVMSAFGFGLPLLGLSWVAAVGGAFGGFGTLAGLARLNRRRRRKQFLQAPLPRAYLPAAK